MTQIKHALFACANRLLQWTEASTVRLNKAIAAVRYESFLRLVHRPRSDDIFIVTYPKAGTTVMQMMVYSILGDGRLSFEHIDHVVPWFEIRYLRDPKYYDTLPSPRVFKTHQPRSRLPRNASYIYVLRNAKDTCVSFYFHLISSGAMVSQLAQFVERFVRGEVAGGSWFEHLAGCCQTQTQGRVLVVNFDDIATKLEEVVDRVSVFCGRSLSAEHRARVVAHCRFDFMKHHNARFDPRQAMKPRTRPKTEFVRRGTPGDWVDHLTPALAAAIDRRCEQALEEMGGTLTAEARRVLEPTGGRRCGTLQVRLGEGGTSEAQLGITEVGELGGLKVAVDGQPLKVGDEVRLEIQRTDSDLIIVDCAEVAAVTDKLMDLRFVKLAPHAAEQLKAHTSLR